MAGEPTGVREQLRDLFALRRGVLVLSVAMFAFSLAYQMTGRYIPEYLSALGFAVYAVFPALLISAPANALVIALLFAFSGLRFAGLPAHKALIVGPAEANAGGRVVGSYYLVRNALTIPSAALGRWLYGVSPSLAFGLATVVGLAGTGYFFYFGEDFTVDGR